MMFCLKSVKQLKMVADIMEHCIFCKHENKIAENETAYARLDGFPVSNGHTLIIPKRHVKTYFDLTDDEIKDIFSLAKEVKFFIDNTYKPDGYNIGFNVNEAGGQTVEHCHMHIIPRYKGDVENPRGGVRNVISNKADYLNQTISDI